MADNLRHWDALKKTDPKHTKPFQRSGGFRGTAIKPIYSVEKMTEHFGPCGIGWGYGTPDFKTVEAAGETLVFCTLLVWYRDGESEAKLFGVGGDRVTQKRKDALVADDEAFKKAFTDALTNALKHIGVGADVHMGQFEDSKYVRELEAEFAVNGHTTNGSKPPAVAEFWQRASYTIPVQKDEHGGSDWVTWAGRMRKAAEQAPDAEKRAKLRQNNAANLAGLKEIAPGEFDRISALIDGKPLTNAMMG